MLESFSQAIVTISFPDGRKVLQPSPRVGGGEFPFDEPVHIVTAYNPNGEVGTEAENSARHEALVADTASRGIETLPTVGSARDGSIPEPGLLLRGVRRKDAIGLGARFRQAAIYEWRADALVIVAVRSDDTLALGWELTDRRPPHGR